MSSIDRRVVEAKFDNKQFHAGVKNTLDDISALNKGLKFDGASKGLGELNRSAGKFNFNALSEGISGLTRQFDTLRVVGVAVLSTIATKAVMAGGQFAKAFTIQPLKDGLEEYETNLNSIQTIMSNTQWEDKTLVDVQGALQELNEYADLTIYNFAEMARNIGTFTAAGVELDVSVNAIKGIANLAAVSGANSQQASTAMYQLSQALSTGTVKLMDWNSVVNAGMGGKVFQDAVKDTARAHGVAIDDIIEQNGSFRDSLQEGWFTAEILTDTLATFTGDLSEQQLKQMGYTDEQIVGILEMGETAIDAATKVKTFTQLIDVMKEAVGTGWADTWTILFGDFEEAKELWTGVSDVLSEFVGNASDSRNQLLQDWKDLGGRTALLDGIVNVFESLWSAIEPISDAFQDFLPGISAERLVELTEGFRDFFENFKMGEENAANLKRTFDGVFGAIGIGWEVLKEVGGFLLDVFQEIFKGGGDLLQVTGDIGEAISDFYERVKAGEGLGDFFDKLAGYVRVGADAVRDFADWIDELFASNGTELSSSLGSIVEAGKQMAPIWEKIGGVIAAVAESVGGVFAKIGTFIMELPAKISDYLSQVDWNLVLSSINTGLFGAFLIMMNNFVNNIGGKGIVGALGELSEGFADSINGITGSLDKVTGTLGTMQNTLRAATLVQIAIALGIMAWSLTALARIDPGDLAKAMSAMAGLFVELGAALLAINLTKVTGLGSAASGIVILAVGIRILVSSVKELAKLDPEALSMGLMGLAGVLSSVVAISYAIGNPKGLISTGTGLVILAAGIKVLASAVTDLSGLSWDEMARGLAGVGGLLASLAIFTRLVAANKAGVVQGAGLLLLAAGIKVLASAAGDFASMSVGEITKGLVAITAILAAFAGFSQLANPAGMVRTGAALLIVSGAMYVLAQATEEFADLSWGEIARGLVGMGGALVILGTALSLIPASSLASAGALVIASVGLVAIAHALEQFGGMEWGEIGKGLLVLGGTLALLAIGLTAMSGTLLGSAALLIAAGALMVLTPTLFLLGGLSWEAIGKGMVVLAGAFAILGAAGYLLAPTVPTFLGLSAAFLLLGAGVALLGVGVNLLATAFATLARVGGDVGATITALLVAIGEAIPALGEGLANGFISFVEAIASGMDGLMEAVTSILLAILESVKELIPDIVGVVVELALNLVDALTQVIPAIAQAALDIMLAILTSLTEKAPQIVDELISLAVALLNVLAERVGEFASAATALMVAFLQAIADNLGDVIAAGVEIVVELIKGVGEAIEDVVDAGVDVVIALVEGISGSMLKMVDAGMEAIINFINGLAGAIDEHAPELREAGIRLAGAIVNGMTFGLAEKGGAVISGARRLAGDALGAAADALGVRSPSREFRKLGQYVGDGFVEGLVGSREKVLRTWSDMWGLLKDAKSKALDEREQLERDVADRMRKFDAEREKALKHRAELEEAMVEMREKEDKSDDDLRRMLKIQRDLGKNWEKRASIEERRQKVLDHQAKKEAEIQKRIDGTTDALARLKKSRQEERAQLARLGRQYDINAKKLDNAKQKLEDATRTRDDYRRSVIDQMDDLPDISQGYGVERFINELRDSRNELSTFTTYMQRLRKMGLGDDMYEELLSQGPGSLRFVKELAAGGKKSIREINALTKQMGHRSRKLGNIASKELYQAGVDSAQGLVDGLKKKERAINNQMQKIAKALSRAVKRELGIRSPSKVMSELGEFTVEGLALGMKKSTPVIEKAASAAGDSAVQAMKKSISDVADLIKMDTDINPTVKPVIDMSEIKKGADEINKTLSNQQLLIDGAYTKAKYASAGYQANVADRISEAKMEAISAPAPVINYVQNNNSPKALSSAEIYRQTKNQLSQTKGALTPNVAQEA